MIAVAERRFSRCWPPFQLSSTLLNSTAASSSSLFAQFNNAAHHVITTITSTTQTAIHADRASHSPPEREPAPGVQQQQGGGWTREALVV